MAGRTREDREQIIESFQTFARTLNDEQLAARFAVGEALHAHELEALTREICVRFVGQQGMLRAIASGEEGDGLHGSNAQGDPLPNTSSAGG